MKIDAFRGAYCFLSNFFPCPVRLDGFRYSSAEAAFQAGKAKNEPAIQQAFASMSPSEAKKFGREVFMTKEELKHWEETRITRMTEVVRAKFNQNPELRDLLVQTFPLELVEGNNWNDRFWGACGGKGENHLGKILMKIRAELTEKRERGF